MKGRLIGVGLGPGDPELLTLKAHRLISSADVIAYPALEKGDSFARSIAAEFIKDGSEEIVISIPMTVAREPAQAAYDKGAAAISLHLEQGKDVVVLCEGDPFFYGSFMYLYSRLAGDYEAEVIPGVTSITACAALMGQPLSARNEMLSVIPGPTEKEELRQKIENADAIAIMKVGRHLAKIKSVLKDLGLTDHASYVERASLPNQLAVPLKDAPETAPYFSMILVTKGNDPWL